MDLSKLIECRPTPRQLAWQKMEFYGFVHFTVNTFTDLEWGDGTEDEKVFAPTAPDFCDQWAAAAAAAGMSGLILTAKHHDGFCLWPSKYTTHSVANSAVAGRDIVREFTDACRKYGLKAGLYLSPWDRHEKTYGMGKEYNDYYCAQLEELTTQYGPLFTVWLDGACGEGPNGKRQVYDFERIFAMVRKNQPDAVIFNGPDVRWCGNEAGRGRESEFSVVPVVIEDEGAEDLGSREAIGDKEVCWHPAEVDTSIRKGWFYHEYEEPRTLEDLQKVWLASAGANATLLLNLPPDRTGYMHDTDVARLKELGDWIREMKGHVLAESTTEARFPQATVTHVILHEDIAQGQLVERAVLQAHMGTEWVNVGRCGAIGYQKVVTLEPTVCDGIRLVIAETRAQPHLLPFTVHGTAL